MTVAEYQARLAAQARKKPANASVPPVRGITPAAKESVATDPAAGKYGRSSCYVADDAVLNCHHITFRNISKELCDLLKRTYETHQPMTDLPKCARCGASPTCRMTPATDVAGLLACADCADEVQYVARILTSPFADVRAEGIGLLKEWKNTKNQL